MRPAAAIPGLHRGACRGMPTKFQPHTCETDRDTKEHTEIQRNKLLYYIDM